MTESWLQQMEAWHDFYVITGSAAAGLTGLMFVVVSLSPGTVVDRTAIGVRAFVTPTVVYFTTVLVVAAVAQLMLVLDGTIVNIALPSAQQALGFSNSDRQWVVTAYALAFGSLLLLGGRIADLFGRKRVFITGLLTFSFASALCAVAKFCSAAAATSVWR